MVVLFFQTIVKHCVVGAGLSGGQGQVDIQSRNEPDLKERRTPNEATINRIRLQGAHNFLFPTGDLNSQLWNLIH